MNPSLRRDVVNESCWLHNTGGVFFQATDSQSKVHRQVDKVVVCHDPFPNIGL